MANKETKYPQTKLLIQTLAERCVNTLGTTVFPDEFCEQMLSLETATVTFLKGKLCSFQFPARNTHLPGNKYVGERHVLVKNLQKLEIKRSWSMTAPVLPSLVTETGTVAFL